MADRLKQGTGRSTASLTRALQCSLKRSSWRSEAIASAWKPILAPTTDTGSRARAAIASICNDLAIQPNKSHLFPQLWEEALLGGYLALTCDECWWAWAEDRLNCAIECGTLYGMHLPLHGGLCGLGWVTKHLRKLCAGESKGDNDLIAEIEPEVCWQPGEADEIDARVAKILNQGVWREDYGLVNGLVGFGVYFLEGMPSERSERSLAMIIDQLDACAEQTCVGMTWPTPPQHLPEWKRGRYPSGLYCSGAAHGVAGVIYLMAAAAAAGVEVLRASRILEQAFAWLIDQHRSVALDPGPEAHLSWCSGELGIASIALLAARSTRRDDWLRFGSEVLQECIDYSVTSPRIRDPNLCHGAAGIAHMFNRIYQREGDLRCRDMAISWFTHALNLGEAGRGIGGFSAVRLVDRSADVVGFGEVAWPQFCDGTIGLALALLAASTTVEPVWDRLLLLSSLERLEPTLF